MNHQTVAIAVVRDDPPSILVADDLEVLHRALAVRLVARADPTRISATTRDALRSALLDERWSDAVALWIEQHGIAIDVYTEDVLSGSDLPQNLLGAQMQLSPLFSDP
jgi:hypothetical protein